MLTPEIVTTGGAVVAGLLAYAGIRYTANKGAEQAEQGRRTTREQAAAQLEMEQRKLDRETFDAFLRTYRDEQARVQAELDLARTDLIRCWTLLRSASRYIRVLRRTMSDNNLDPPPMPDDLESTPEIW